MLKIVGEERILMDSIKVRRWKMQVGHAPMHLKELHSMIIEDMVEGKRPPGQTFIFW